MERLNFDGKVIKTIKADEIEGSNCTLNTAEGTFLRTNNTLSITLTDNNTNAKIKELTAVKLVLIPENSEKTFEYERSN